jgi:hypothetical protein
MEIIGSGGYGLVIFDIEENKVIKLFYDINDCKALNKEALMQEKCREIIMNINDTSEKYLGVKVPKIYEKFNEVVNPKIPKEYNLPIQYLCGIVMEKITPPLVDGFYMNEQIHIGLGLEFGSNQSWICSNGITRGFYANSDMLKTILEEVPHQENFTLSNIAYTLGVVYRELIDNHIRPFDVEILLGTENNNLVIYMIDFGKVENTNISHYEYYYDKSYKGLASDSYIPHFNKNDTYSQDFYDGFFKT